MEFLKKLFSIYDNRGFNKNGIHKNGTQYDEFGFDYYGYNINGYDKLGYNKSGYNINGFDKFGYDKFGYNKFGYNQKGFDKTGYDRNGYNWKGYDKLGYDKFGYNEKGFDKTGYDKNGFNELGYDRNGVCRLSLSKASDLVDNKGELIPDKLLLLKDTSDISRIPENMNIQKRYQLRSSKDNRNFWGYYDLFYIDTDGFSTHTTIKRNFPNYVKPYIRTLGEYAYCYETDKECYEYKVRYKQNPNEYSCLKGLPCSECIKTHESLNEIEDFYY